MSRCPYKVGQSVVVHGRWWEYFRGEAPTGEYMTSASRRGKAIRYVQPEDVSLDRGALELDFESKDHHGGKDVLTPVSDGPLFDWAQRTKKSDE